MKNYCIPGWREVSIEIDGIKYYGHYTIEKKILAVSYNGYTEKTHNSYNNYVYAKIILGRMVRKFRND